VFLSARDFLLIPDQPWAIQQHADMIENIASHDAAFLIADKESPSKNAPEKNELETCDVGNAFPPVKTHDLIRRICIHGYAKLSN
jgi:hypothetical protein